MDSFKPMVTQMNLADSVGLKNRNEMKRYSCEQGEWGQRGRRGPEEGGGQKGRVEG